MPPEAMTSRTSKCRTCVGTMTGWPHLLHGMGSIVPWVADSQCLALHLPQVARRRVLRSDWVVSATAGNIAGVSAPTRAEVREKTSALKGEDFAPAGLGSLQPRHKSVRWSGDDEIRTHQTDRPASDGQRLSIARGAHQRQVHHCAQRRVSLDFR